MGIAKPVIVMQLVFKQAHGESRPPALSLSLLSLRVVGKVFELITMSFYVLMDLLLVNVTLCYV